MSSSYTAISTALTTGTIIAIAVGTVGGLAICIGIIIIIVCLVKRSNRRNVATRGMVLQQQPVYPYPQPWQNQYPPNTTSVAHYPPTGAPYTAAGPYYGQPMVT